jgi:hypothetical protein
MDITPTPWKALSTSSRFVPMTRAPFSTKANACPATQPFGEAIEPLTRLLSMETNNFSKAHYLAQFMRAKAYLGEEK